MKLIPNLLSRWDAMRWKDFCLTRKYPKFTEQQCDEKFPGIGKRVYYALYHPAAALYQGSLRKTLIEDFKKIPKVLKAIEKENDVQVSESLETAKREEKNRFEEEKKQEALF